MSGRYRKLSIRANTKTSCVKEKRAIWRVIKDRGIPLPANCRRFLALEDNKADLARFLSEELITHAPHNKTIVVSGGFPKEEEVQCSNPAADITALQSNNEEVDTRVILHAIHYHRLFDNIVVSARHTDVPLLLLAHLNHITCTVRLWMGTSKKPNTFLLIKSLKIFHKVQKGRYCSSMQSLVVILPPTSVVILRRTAWKDFKENSELLLSLEDGDLTTETIKCAEVFICKLYKVSVESVDRPRFLLFAKMGTSEKLPPTSDAFKYHVMRSHFQTMVWRQAINPIQSLPKPEDMGWRIDGDHLVYRSLCH